VRPQRKVQRSLDLDKTSHHSVDPCINILANPVRRFTVSNKSSLDGSLKALPELPACDPVCENWGKCFFPESGKLVVRVGRTWAPFLGK